MCCEPVVPGGRQNEQERNHSGGQKWMKGHVQERIQLPWVLFSKLFAASRISQRASSNSANQKAAV